MSDQTALEGARLVVRGERGELAVDQGRITISKQAPTRDAPTTVEFGVDQVRGTDLQAPSRGGRGWLHVGVVGGSPAPPGDLAAAGDPYTLPLTSRSVGSARRFAKLVDRHVQARGMPRETGLSEGRLSSSVAITRAPVTPRPAAAQDTTPAPAFPPPPPPTDVEDGDRTEPSDLVAELQALAELHGSGALTDEEFERAKARLLG
ncbi:SHOCT domain-containing protein [Nitriliruptor alkaliphilus]|uniref:SHOCT domain-containing protein n=1 Tax=Nitriliruptor alkaliphilus TaxID=427918 RepID=UPI000698C461|nr:SHOCT domain-containing protein [Nitriliruptor alkaliphilus]